MSEVVAERKEIVRAILTQARKEVEIALAKLDDYDQPHFIEIERAAGALINFFPANQRNGACY
jgi:uncharacterized protein YlxP (DUF503 family)